MPLQTGSSQETISKNIQRLMREYRLTGKIGNTKPRDTKHAMEIASAISYRKARETNPRISK